MEKIIELTKKWYEIVSTDHHKDRDCHFYVNTVYSYGNNPVFRIEHYGYIAEDYTEDFETYEEAENGLIEFLKGNILNEKSWAEGVLKEKEKWDSDQIERAENIIKITNLSILRDEL
jgi:hypothetical protein